MARYAAVYDMGSTTGHVGEIAAELERARVPFTLFYRPNAIAYFRVARHHHNALVTIIRRVLGFQP
jgi:hypothetical protein